MNNRWIMRSKTPSLLLFTAKNVINATKNLRVGPPTAISLPLSYRQACASAWHDLARFGGMEGKAYLCLSRKRKSAGFSSFCVFGQTILYEQEKSSYRIVKIISKSVKICSGIIFPMCFIVNTSLFFAEIFKERILLSLIIPKLSRRIALTIANAPFTLCAESADGINKFCLSSIKKQKRRGARCFPPANPAPSIEIRPP